ncbi:hypothetical protein [Nocardia huaxiensis]|uniref:hypothetical protein n=1 Tax=Nocardia huaxiensis TaxID=2755382 RepID=UPI001FD55567|nr:hypothetical protein [Nocardia huaxiensis]
MAHQKTVTRNTARMNGASQGCEQIHILATRPGGELLFWQMSPQHALGHAGSRRFIMTVLQCRVARFYGMQLRNHRLQLVTGDLLFEHVQPLEDCLIESAPGLVARRLIQPVRIAQQLQARR